MGAHVHSQIRTLASAVARSFAAADLLHEDRYPERIENTRLPWNVPALMPTASLDGEDLAIFYDSPVKVEAQALHAFWEKTLHDMWNKPEGTLTGGAYAGLQRLLKTTKLGVRVLRFAQPPGYPGQFELRAGVQLSLEVAHLAYISLPIFKRVWTLDDYYVIASTGQQFGVRAGRPIVDSPWDFDASGSVMELLESPRGPTTYDCHYDEIAALRSVLHSHPDAFGAEFDGLDNALQALRYLSWGSYCPSLTTAMQTTPVDMKMWARREALLRDALDVMRSNRLNDKQKLQTLRQTLVPDVLTPSRFKAGVFSGDGFPFTLLPGKAEKIVAFLYDYYNTEVPCSLRRSL